MEVKAIAKSKATVVELTRWQGDILISNQSEKCLKSCMSDVHKPDVIDVRHP